MTVLKLKTLDLDTWVKQNDGLYIDCIQGCLTDNFLIVCKRVYAVAKETYLNEWNSTHTIYFQKYPSRDVLNMWDEMTAEDERTA